MIIPTSAKTNVKFRIRQIVETVLNERWEYKLTLCIRKYVA